MTRDPIVAEIRKFRAEHAKRFNYDIRAIFEDARKRQATRKNVVDLSVNRQQIGRVAEDGVEYIAERKV